MGCIPQRKTRALGQKRDWMHGSKNNGDSPQQIPLIPQPRLLWSGLWSITVGSNSPAPLPLNEIMSVVQLIHVCSGAPHGIRLRLEAS